MLYKNSAGEDLQLLTAKQVRELVGVCRMTLHNWERRGILIPVRIGRMVRYKASDIECLGKLNGVN